MTSDVCEPGQEYMSFMHFNPEVPDKALIALQVEAVPLQDLAVRFSCATRELQFLGLIKEAPRSRKDGIVQRLAYPMRVQTA